MSKNTLFNFQWLIACCVAGAMTTSALGDPLIPPFGSTLELKGQTFYWLYATESNGKHYDKYIDSYGLDETEIVSLINSTALASVLGYSAGQQINGHLINGVYAENYREWDDFGAFTYEGYDFERFIGNETIHPDITTGTLPSSGIYNYYGPNGTYIYAWNQSGPTSWQRAVTDTTAVLTPSSSLSSLSLFGENFTFDDGTITTGDHSGWSSSGGSWWWSESSNWNDMYVSSNGWLSVASNEQLNFDPLGNFTTYSFGVTFWTPFLGYIEASGTTPYAGMSGLEWSARTAPKFAPAQIWVKLKTAPAGERKLLTWQSGEVTPDGRVVDLYGTGDLVVEISGGSEGGNQVKVNETNNGEFDSVLEFTNTGSYEILTANDVSPAWIDDAPFFNASTSLWVDGTEYLFREAYQDQSGTRVDVYANPAAGTVTLLGSTTDATAADVQISHLGSLESATYDDGDFVTYYFLVTTTASTLTHGPAAWWVNGRLLFRSAPGADTYTAGTDSITVTTSDAGVTLAITGTVGGVSVTGSVSGTAAGLVFMDNTAVSGTTIPVLRASGDGSLVLGTTAPPEDFPPAVMAAGKGMWRFLASVTAEDVTTAYYAQAGANLDGQPADARGWVLAVNDEGIATLTNLVTEDVFSGTYDTTTHLFQTLSGEEDALPVVLVAVDSSNGAVWGQDGLPEGLPPSLMVRGAPWWYAGTDENDISTYQGFYEGQTMTVGPLVDGSRAVTLTDPVFNAAKPNPNGVTTGTLSDVRGSARLRDGTLVVSGNSAGTLEPVVRVDDDLIHTIAADLDIVGNNISFGVRPDDASIAGAVFNFAGDASTATLHSILSKPQARWGWWKAGETESAPLQPVMWLDDEHKLRLYPVGSSDAAIVLNPDPEGTSSFRGPVRVPAGGDIPMGAFQEGDPP